MLTRQERRILLWALEDIHVVWASQKTMKRSWLQRFKASSAHTQASIVFSAVIMVATIAYSIIADFQLRVMREASQSNTTQTALLIQAANINAEASKRNAIAAESFSSSAVHISDGIGQAVAKLQTQAEKMETARQTAEVSARRALNAAINSSRTDERAWIDLVVFAPSAFQADRPFSTDAQIKNLGKTPAKNIRMGDTFQGLGKQDSYTFDDAKLGMVKMGILPPQGPANRPVEITPGKPQEILGNARFDAIDNGKLVVFYWGLITYDDVFGVSHWLKFCYIYNAPHARFDLCSTHNDIDGS